MGWDGSGNYSRTNGDNTGATTWQSDKADGDKIVASRHDTHDQDLADGINACLTKNGENAMSGNLKTAKGADVASATALALGADGNYFDITGTTTIATINTIAVGTQVTLHFDDALTLTHSADLVLPGGADITTAAGDEATFIEYAAGDWRCINYQRAADGPGNVILGTRQTISVATTNIDFTIPSGVKSIIVLLEGLTTDGNGWASVQIGDSGGIETAGYTGWHFTYEVGSGVDFNSGDTSYWRISGNTLFSNPQYGSVKLFFGRPY